jgi:hypothetical protein
MAWNNLNLKQLTSGMFSRESLNSNFDKIEDGVGKQLERYPDDYEGVPDGNAMHTELDMNGNRIINYTATPVNGDDITNKAYVDARDSLLESQSIARDNSLESESIVRDNNLQTQIDGNLSAIQNIEVSGTIKQDSEEFTATLNQTDFTLTSATFAGDNTLAVYINGVRQSHSSYTTFSTDTVIFSEGLQEGDKVLLTVNESVSTTFGIDQIEGLEDSLTDLEDSVTGLTTATIQTLLSVNPTVSSTVFVKNYHSDVEGGGGVFYWDATKAKSEHNGGTIIDPTAIFPTDWSVTTQQETWFNTSNAGVGCWVRQYDGAVNVKWFGAKGDGVTDDTKALKNTVSFLKHLKGGQITLDAGTYYVTDTIEVDSNIHFAGQGGGILTNVNVTTILTNGLVTAFKVKYGGDHSSFSKMRIEASSKNTATTTGSAVAEDNTLTLANPLDFKNHQLIKVHGVGTKRVFRGGRTTFSGTANSDILTSLDVIRIPLGTLVNVTDADFTGDVEVVEIVSDTEIRVSENVVTSFNDQDLEFYEDMVFMIIAGEGTTSITLNEQPNVSRSNAKVTHYDSALYALRTMAVDSDVVASGFQGAGLVLQAGNDVVQDVGDSSDTNVNNSIIKGLTAYNNTNGVYIRGFDANACKFYGLNVFSNTEWQLVETSFLGNYYFGTHLSGGYGLLVTSNKASNYFSGTYCENGTFHSMDRKTTCEGGYFAGLTTSGASYRTSTEMSNTKVVNTYMGKLTSEMHLGDNQGVGGVYAKYRYISKDEVGASCDISERFSSSAGEGNTGAFGWFAGYNKPMIAYSTSRSAMGVGVTYLPKGVMMGRDGRMGDTYYRRQVGGIAAPTTGDWVRGDIVFSHAPVAGGSVGWVCTVSGTPGTWKTFGAISA